MKDDTPLINSELQKRVLEIPIKVPPSRQPLALRPAGTVQATSTCNIYPMQRQVPLGNPGCQEKADPGGRGEMVFQGSSEQAQTLPNV